MYVVLQGYLVVLSFKRLKYVRQSDHFPSDREKSSKALSFGFIEWAKR